MSSYEERQEAKRERLLNAADKAQAKSEAAHKVVDQIVGAIPLGQPILVGHHSEKRHRRDIDRMGRAMDRSVSEQKKAEHLRGRALSVGEAGIASDDPEAVVKLKAELAAIEAEIENIKAVNAAYRKGGLEALAPAAAEAFRKLKAIAPYEKQPYPSYRLTNCNANARRIRQRIEDLQQLAAGALFEFAGFDFVEDRDDGRFVLTVNSGERLSQERYQLVRRYGFVWARSRGAFVRKITPNAAASARRLATELQKTAPKSGCTPCDAGNFNAPAAEHSCGVTADDVRYKQTSDLPVTGEVKNEGGFGDLFPELNLDDKADDKQLERGDRELQERKDGER